LPLDASVPTSTIVEPSTITVAPSRKPLGVQTVPFSMASLLYGPVTSTTSLLVQFFHSSCVRLQDLACEQVHLFIQVGVAQVDELHLDMLTASVRIIINLLQYLLG